MPITHSPIPQIALNDGATIPQPAQIILRWHMQHDTIAIPKSARPERTAENFDGFDFKLSTEEIAAIDALDRGPEGRVGPNPDTYEGV